MGENITITIDDLKLRQYFSQLKDRGINPRLLLAQIGSIMEDEIAENFDQQGRPSKWKPLKSSTMKQRTKKGYTGPILQNTGRLKRSFTTKVANSDVTVGTNLEYAAIQNFGGQAGRGRKTTIPKREFIIITEEGLNDIVKAAENYLDI